MPLYVVLCKMTDKRMEGLKDMYKGAEIADKMLADLGIKKLFDLFTMGRYDGIMIFDAPNDESMWRFLFDFGRLGAIRTETLKAWNYTEMLKIVKELPKPSWEK